MLAAVLGAAYFVIAFLLRRVLLADVVEPIRRRHRIVTQVGQHLQVICRDPAWMANHVNDLHLLRRDAGRNRHRRQDAGRHQARGVGQRPPASASPLPTSRNRPGRCPLLEKKLEIVEAADGLAESDRAAVHDAGHARDLDAWIREQCESSPDRDRWSRLIARLRVTELPARSADHDGERWKHYFRNLLQGWREEFLVAVAGLARAAALASPAPGEGGAVRSEDRRNRDRAAKVAGVRVRIADPRSDPRRDRGERRRTLSGDLGGAQRGRARAARTRGAARPGQRRVTPRRAQAAGRRACSARIPSCG